MMRFIDLRGQVFLDDSPYFAFFDTINDMFCTFEGEESWQSIDDFKQDYKGHELDRFLRLIPKDYFQLATSPTEETREDLKNLVNQQAEDEGLWFVAQYASEAYLQAALRKLHAYVEDFIDPCTHKWVGKQLGGRTLRSRRGRNKAGNEA